MHPAAVGASLQSTAVTSVATLAVVAVLAVLIFGVWNMGRENSQSLSQKLMRWRVALQFVAVVLLMAVIAGKKLFG